MILPKKIAQARILGVELYFQPMLELIPRRVYQRQNQLFLSPLTVIVALKAGILYFVESGNISLEKNNI
jgi:hypothetical protein